MPVRHVLAATALLLGAVFSSSPAAEPVDFVKQIKPILEKSCLKCHSEEETNGGLRLDIDGA